MKKVAILFIVLLTSSFVFAQKTYVPDDKFEQALIDLGYDTTLDDSVLTANISGVTTLDVSNKEISDLTGIEAFTALTYLDCNHNKLTSLDVSANTALTFLHCYSNQLTSLDVSANTALTNLHCGSNQLTSLDVSLNTALTYLNVERMSMASLDVSNNTALTQLYCSKNQITSLDVSNNTALTELIIHDNQLTSLEVSKNTALTLLNVNNNKLTSLDVSKNTVLKFFKCADNQLTSLDVSNNTALETLDCYVNQLTSLDVSANTALTKLDCNSNQLTSLDVSSNTNLTSLQCSYNQLTNLNMRNGITDELTTFNATKSGTALTCIEVLDPAWATANWTSANGNIEEGVTFAVICGGTDLTTWHVATTGSDASGSGTEMSPLATIQTGINAATDSDTVLVAAGTYKENIKLNFNDISIIGKNRETTIIDGDQKGTVVKFHRYHNHNKTVLSGFSITNGKGTVDEGGPWGGGIEINGAGVKVKPLLRDLIIENNTALNGAGIHLYNSASPNIENCIIRNNQAIYPDPSGKWAAGTGGGISADGYEGTMKNVLFAENSSLSGGALSIFNGNTTLPVNIVNCTFVNNYSFENSDIFLDGASTLHVTNTIIWDDILISQLNGTVTLNVDNSLIQGGYSGEGNLDVNPFFVNVDTTGGIKGDYHLKDWSPAIGAGTATGAPTTDIEGNPRPNPAGSNPDMGAFENKWGTPQNAPPVLTVLSDLSIYEDSSITVTLEAINADSADNDVITFSSISDTSAVTASISDSILTLTPNANWHGVANIKAYASDGTSKDSTSFKLTVTPVQDAPTAFDWVSSALDTINITKSNLADAYTLQWDASTDVDGETINYLIYAKIGLYLTEEVEEITDTTFQLIYEEILEHVFEGQPINAATVRFSIKATDGIDTVDVTGDDRVLFVNRYEYLSTVGEGVPVEFALHENYPNPFNPTTTLRFDLPEVSNLTLTIYNMLGQKVRTFNMQSTPAGYHSVKWNATNDYGDPVGAGVYLYQLQTKDFVKTRKMVLLK